MTKPKTEANTSPPRAQLPDQTWFAPPQNQPSEQSGQALQHVPAKLSAEVRQRLIRLAREMFGDTMGASVGLLLVALEQEHSEP